LFYKVFIDMKGFIKKLLRESLLNEKLTDIDDDVNLLYVKYFEYDVNQLVNTNIITDTMFLKSEIDTSILNSPESIESHKLNPCTIKINFGSNFYQPSTNIISVSVNSNALNFVKNESKGDILLAANSLYDERQKKSLIHEFTEERIKGSIHHELAHWIDDTLHNRHIAKRLNKAMELKDKNIKNIPVNATKMEVQAQIHNVKQLHNKHSNTWDLLSFNDMLSYSPPLTSIYNSLSGDIRKRWVRDLKTRMYREGLLGKNMF
jgi:hypothetical protein